MKRVVIAASALAAAAVLTACGSEPPGAIVTVSATVTAPTTLTTATTVTAMATVTSVETEVVVSTAKPPTTKATPKSGPDIKKIGTKQQGLHDNTAVVLEYKDDLSEYGDLFARKDGKRWTGVLVEMCIAADAEPTTTGPTPWSSRDTGNGVHSALSVSGGGITLEPMYPAYADVIGGDCTKGWLTFEVPEDAKLTQIRYAPNDGTESALRIWAVE